MDVDKWYEQGNLQGAKSENIYLQVLIASISVYRQDMGTISFLRGNDGNRAWKAYFFAEIERLGRELPEGSDSWMPHRPTDKVKRFAELIVKPIERTDLPRPFVVPGSEGDLQIKWCVGPKELSFFVADTKAEYLRAEKTEVREGELTDSKQVKELIDWLVT